MDIRPRTRAATIEEVSRLLQSVAREFDRAAAECLDGVSIPQWHVLAALEGGIGKPMAALGAATLLPGPSRHEADRRNGRRQPGHAQG